MPHGFPKRASSGKKNQKEAIPEEISSGHPEIPAVKGRNGRIRASFSVRRTQVQASGKPASQNNSNLALQDTPVDRSEMGTIRNDGSHLCFQAFGLFSITILHNNISIKTIFS